MRCWVDMGCEGTFSDWVDLSWGNYIWRPKPLKQMIKGCMISTGLMDLFQMRLLPESSGIVISPHRLIIASNAMKLLMLLIRSPSQFRLFDGWGHQASSEFKSCDGWGFHNVAHLFHHILLAFQIPIHHSSFCIEFNLSWWY